MNSIKTRSCESCKGMHTDLEVGARHRHKQYVGTCPVTKRSLVWDGHTDYHYLNNLPAPNKWIIDTSHVMGCNAHEIVPESGVFYSTCFNFTPQNICILFNKEREWVLINFQNEIADNLTDDEKVRVQEIVDNTLDTYCVFNIDDNIKKNTYGADVYGYYYIIPKSDTYELPHLMKQYFSTHARQSKNTDVMKEAYNRLVKDTNLKV